MPSIEKSVVTRVSSFLRDDSEKRRMAQSSPMPVMTDLRCGLGLAELPNAASWRIWVMSDFSGRGTP